jgi:hypothetical protein
LRVSLLFVSLCGEKSYQSDTLEESGAQMGRALTALSGNDDKPVEKTKRKILILVSLIWAPSRTLFAAHLACVFVIQVNSRWSITSTLVASAEGECKNKSREPFHPHTHSQTAAMQNWHLPRREPAAAGPHSNFRQ